MHDTSRLPPPRAVFLTGATGYLGAFLLDRLLARGTGPVHCLVRAPDEARGLERLLAVQDGYGLAGQTAADRIIPVPGELARPGLALATQARDRIEAEADLFVHCAASTNFLFGAPLLRIWKAPGRSSIWPVPARAAGCIMSPVLPFSCPDTTGGRGWPRIRTRHRANCAMPGATRRPSGKRNSGSGRPVVTASGSACRGHGSWGPTAGPAWPATTTSCCA